MILIGVIFILVIKKETEGNNIKFDFFVGDRNIGYADGMIKGDTFEFHYIYIYEEVRKLGYGSAVLKLMEEELKLLNIKIANGDFIAEDDQTQKQLHDFYIKNGYAIVDGVIIKQLS
ncbi:N-acetyltransferase domain-containing protein OS=Ureibacillus acetophenoni OX=614649 GN=SAMN05877842_10465 PE=4 SV=1 [Ureibacillus acetophenoni]